MNVCVQACVYSYSCAWVFRHGVVAVSWCLHVCFYSLVCWPRCLRLLQLSSLWCACSCICALCLCVCVCACVCVCWCVGVTMWVCVFVGLRACVSARVEGFCICVCVHVCARVHRTSDRDERTPQPLASRRPRQMAWRSKSIVVSSQKREPGSFVCNYSERCRWHRLNIRATVRPSARRSRKIRSAIRRPSSPIEAFENTITREFLKDPSSKIV